MEEKFRFGIMGAGNIAEEFCQSVEKTGIACVAAVAGRTPGKAERLAALSLRSKAEDFRLKEQP